MTLKPNPSEGQVKESSDRLVWARLRILACAREMGVGITFEETERFSLILLGLEDDVNKSARETHEKS